MKHHIIIEIMARDESKIDVHILNHCSRAGGI